MKKTIFSVALLLVAPVTSGQHHHPGSGGPDGGAHAPLDWRSLESGVLSNYVQLTTREDFLKAGEAYFSPDSNWIIFQATPVPPEGETAEPNYEMYIAPLERDPSGRVTGMGAVVQLSKAGSANTCGWWHPSEPGRLLFSSTIEPPKEENEPGYQRGSSRYRWAFPVEMDIVTTTIKNGVAGPVERLFTRHGYDAESSWSPDGRHVLYAHVDMDKSEKLGRPDADLWVYDTRTGLHTAIVTADGYDGGPFFSPDGKWITFRSDRRGDNLLQLFIAELKYDDSGRIVGIEREVQLTDDQNVNWAPFWHPSGRYLIYASSRVSHRNFEVFAIPALDEHGEPVSGREPVRITQADGFDGLPVFNADGSLMMWTSQRGPTVEGEDHPSSQIWLADFNKAMNTTFANGN